MKLPMLFSLRVLFLTLLFFIALPTARAQSDLTLQWAKALSSDTPPYLRIESLKADALGNTYITGSFIGTADFDPDAGVARLTGTAPYTIFFAKYDADGNYVYAKQLAGADSAWGTAITVGADGTVYITGVFKGTVDFDPGKGVAQLTSAGDIDIFLAKYDTRGNYVYAKRMGGKSDDRSTAIAVDGSGNVAIAGYFFGTADFDPGKGVAELSSSGGCDIFLAKYDAQGKYIYAKVIGGTGYDSASGIAFATDGTLYMTGSFERTVDFDPGSGIAERSSAGYKDLFLAHYDGNGNFIFANRMGGKGKDQSNAIAVDGTGSAYITGFYEDTVDFDPGEGVAALVSPKPCALFLAKYDANGHYVYAKSVAGGKGAIGTGVVADLHGNAYITGYFEGTVDFDPGEATAQLTSPGRTKGMPGYENDTFIAKYDPIGKYVYAKSIGGKGYDRGTAIAMDAKGRLYIAGDFESPADFYTANGTYSLQSESSSAAFIACYRQNDTTTGNNNQPRE